ncbi:MAG: proline dehydrogenase family protein [Candidatus Sungbacteria bacterium]|nr:proline dehydrogenase family protein [Candidatus Sungbacteria bacterium]
MAGRTRESALLLGKSLNQDGFFCYFNHIGDQIRTPEERDAACAEYASLLEDMKASGIQAGISTKASSLGMLNGNLHPAKTRKNFLALVKKARDYGIHFWLDGEELCYRSKTSVISSIARAVYPKTGSVIQAYTKKIGDIVFELYETKKAFPCVSAPFRICKGAYAEPLELAYSNMDDIRDRFEFWVRKVAEVKHYVQVATHDEKLIQRVLALEKAGVIQKEEFEFAFLLGVSMPLARKLLGMGYRVSIYVPYGEDAEGFCIRRIIERPRYLILPFKALFRV